MLNLKLQYFGHLMWRVDSLEKTWMLGGVGSRRRRGRQRMRWLDGITDSMEVSLSELRKSCWWTGRPGVLWFMGSQRVGHDWATELNWTESAFIPSSTTGHTLETWVENVLGFCHIMWYVSSFLCQGYKGMFSDLQSENYEGSTKNPRRFFYPSPDWVSTIKQNYHLFLLLCMFSHFSCVRLFAASCTSLLMGFSWLESWSGLPFPTPLFARTRL